MFDLIIKLSYNIKKLGSGAHGYFFGEKNTGRKYSPTFLNKWLDFRNSVSYNKTTIWEAAKTVTSFDL